MCDEASKVAANDAVPCGTFALIELCDISNVFAAVKREDSQSS